jgi:serine/threonine protein kinase
MREPQRGKLSAPWSVQVRGAKPTAKSDIWAFGYSLFRLLTGGKHPKLYRLQDVANELPVRFSDRFAPLILMCLEADPGRRPSAAGLVEYLQNRIRTARRVEPARVVLVEDEKPDGEEEEEEEDHGDEEGRGTAASLTESG